MDPSIPPSLSIDIHKHCTLMSLHRAMWHKHYILIEQVLDIHPSQQEYSRMSPSL